ncbi:MAG: hypothetical protein KGJ93_03160 [Patescibacteria group bacterium]|nr:hypothetical protein [Patescibacteria group bacterium]
MAWDSRLNATEQGIDFWAQEHIKTLVGKFSLGYAKKFRDEGQEFSEAELLNIFDYRPEWRIGRLLEALQSRGLIEYQINSNGKYIIALKPRDKTNKDVSERTKTQCQSYYKQLFPKFGQNNFTLTEAVETLNDHSQKNGSSERANNHQFNYWLQNMLQLGLIEETKDKTNKGDKYYRLNPLRTNDELVR